MTWENTSPSLSGRLATESDPSLVGSVADNLQGSQDIAAMIAERKEQRASSGPRVDTKRQQQGFFGRITRSVAKMCGLDLV